MVRRAHRPLRTILREAWKLRDELDAAAVRAAGTKARRAPAGARKALEVATSALYFGERHKWEGKLHAIIAALDPDVARLLEERGPKEAYEAVHGTE